MLLSREAPTLREQQRGFERLLFGPQTAVGGEDLGGPHRAQMRSGVELGAALAAYRNNSLTALTSALTLSFPAVRQLVGAEFFAAAVHTFARMHPPASAYLNDYGDGFARFLRNYVPATTLGYLPEVAKLEWSLSRALHAADSARLNPARLALIESSDRTRVAFIPHPSVSLLYLSYPADRIWQAVLEADEAAMRRIDLAEGPAWLLVERDALDFIQVQRLQPAVGRFMQRLVHGESIGVALENSIEVSSTEEWNAILAHQLAAGRFVDIKLIEDLASGHGMSQGIWGAQL